MALLDTNRIPPGGWQYSQKDASGNQLAFFHDMGPFLPFCKEILGFRKGNKLPGDNIDCVMADLNTDTCIRLGNDGAWCTGGAPNVYNAGGRMVTGSPCCGG
jgi:hypothetical protein